MSSPYPSLLTETYILQNPLYESNSTHLVVDLNLATHQNIWHCCTHKLLYIIHTHSYITHIPCALPRHNHSHILTWLLESKACKRATQPLLVLYVPRSWIKDWSGHFIKTSPSVWSVFIFFKQNCSNRTWTHILYSPEEVTTHLVNDKGSQPEEARWDLTEITT